MPDERKGRPGGAGGAGGADAGDDQLDFFPVRASVTALDPRAVLGAATRVLGLWKVEWPGERRPHLVYHDRHGWYCEEHGPGCRAVRRAREAGASRG